MKRGLRDEDGRGVLTGLTRVGEIQSYSVTEGEHIIPQDGILYYRGIDARELVKGSVGRRFAFEETAYLLLFGELPTAAQLEDFCAQLASYREAWDAQMDFYRERVLVAAGAAQADVLLDGILALEEYRQAFNQGRMEEIVFSQENQDFVALAAQVRDSGLTGEEAYLALLTGGVPPEQ